MSYYSMTTLYFDKNSGGKNSDIGKIFSNGNDSKIILKTSRSDVIIESLFLKKDFFLPGDLFDLKIVRKSTFLAKISVRTMQYAYR